MYRVSNADRLLVVVRQSSNMSYIFRIGTSSAVFKIYTEMREGWYIRGNDV
jgi:hypothetical protein